MLTTTAATPPRFVTLMLLTWLSVLSLNMFLPSMPAIAEALQADYALVNLSVAGYLGVSAVLQLVMGPLSDRFGRRPVMLAGLAIFTAASLGCLLAAEIWTFLGFRMLQSAVICGWVLSLAAVRDVSGGRDAASRIGYITMAMAVAPMLGPMAGGALDGLFGWRASFAAYAGAGVLALGLVWLDFGETNHDRSVTLTHQLRGFPALMRSSLFWGYALCLMFSVAAFYCFLAGAPLVAEAALSLSPAKLGFYMGSITGGFMFGSFLAGRLAARYALSAMMLAGRITACTGLAAGLVLVWSGLVNELTLFGATLFVGIGNGLSTPSCNVGAMSVRPELAGSASGLAGALTLGGGAALSTLTGVIVTEKNAPVALLGMMLFCSIAGLVAALRVRRLETD